MAQINEIMPGTRGGSANLHDEDQQHQHNQPRGSAQARKRASKARDAADFNPPAWPATGEL